MSTEQTTIDTLLHTFLQALRSRDFTACYTLLADVRSMVEVQTGALASYFEAILANEAERDTAKAEQILVALLEQKLDLSLRARALSALGIAYEYQNQSGKSIAIFQQLLALYETLNQALEQAKTLKNIAIACENGYARGDLEYRQLIYGEQCGQRALALLTELGDHSPALAWEQATTWNSLGALYLHLERWEEAIDCFQRHVAYATTNADDFSLAIAKLNLGEIYQLQGAATWDQAAILYTEALALFQQLDEPYDMVGVLFNLGLLYQQMERPVPALAAYQQAIVLAEQLRTGVTSEIGRAGYSATIETLYAHTILLYIEQGQAEQAFNLTEQARSRAFVDRMALRSDALARHLAEPVMTLRQLQANLPATTLLLAYFTTGLLDAQADGRDKRQSGKRHRFPPAKTLLFVVTHDSLQIYDLQLSPNLLRPNHLENVIERHFLNQAMLRTLYQKLLEPVETLLQTKQRLYLLPHGPLHYIPFQALVAANGEPVARIDGPTFTYAPSATSLLGASNNPTSKATASLLAIGYNAADSDNAHGRLAYAETEAQMVAHQYQGTTFVGAESKKAKLYTHANQYRFLHFSCHGEFIAPTPLDSFLLIGAQERLTAQEIMDQLQLQCELVTLSACESGLSHIRRGDEMMGLVRAFFYAGTRHLLATLWRVEERATFLLMRHFYSQVQAGRDFASALHAAQLYLRNLTYAEAQQILAESEPPNGLAAPTLTTVSMLAADSQIFADPRYWAPFVLFSCAGSFQSLR